MGWMQYLRCKKKRASAQTNRSQRRVASNVKLRLSAGPCFDRYAVRGEADGVQLALVLGPRLPAEAMDLVAQRVARAEEVQRQAGRLAVWEVPATRHAHESRTERARVLGAAYTSTTRQAPNIQTTDGRPRAYTTRKSCQLPGHAHVGVCWPHISTTSLITQTAPMMRSVAESATREKYQAPYPSRSTLQTAFHATRLSCEEPRQSVHARQSLPQTRSSEVAVGASIIGWSGTSPSRVERAALH